MKLIFINGPLAGNTFDVQHETSIGRDPSNDIVIPESSVSLVHCLISCDGQSALIKDLGSTNGTFINDKRIINAELQDGDGLTIGQNRIRVELPESDLQPPGTTRLAPTILMSRTDPQEVDEVEGEQQEDVTELSGSIFGEVTYFFIRKIADGGMGSVYEAEQYGAEGFIKKVAIKTILPRFVRKERFISSFIAEAKLVANLVHENIVQIHHFGRHEDGYYIAMEYIDGISLSDFLIKHLRKRKLPPADISTFIVSQVSCGLEYAHNKRDENGKLLRLVHRDVSPNNIIIARDGEVKLTDFGVAKAAQFIEEDGNYLVGSVEYMSPEQAACEPVDARSDIFSLGLVYYELLTGQRIFQCRDNDVDETIKRVKITSVPDPRLYSPELPEGIFRILMRCLEKHPGQRYQSAGTLGDDLEHEMYAKGMGPTKGTLAKYINDYA